MAVHLRFDRGTIVLDGFVGTKPGVLWDDRTQNYRASAHRYRELRSILGASVVSDAIALRSLGTTTRWLPADLRSYQTEALMAWLAARRRGLIVLPTGAGKTRIAIAAAAAVAKPVAVLCPTRVLLGQWVDALRKYYVGPIGMLGDGDHRIEDVTVMTFESAFRKMDSIGDRFGLLIVDEAHHFGSGLRTEALESSVAPYRIGLTATAPQVGTAAAMMLRDLIGAPVFAMTLGDLAGKHLAPFEVVRLRVSLDSKERAEYARLVEPFLDLRAGLRVAGGDVDFPATVRALARSAAGRRAISDYHRGVALAAFPAQKRRLTANLIERHREDKTLVFAASAVDARTIARDNLVPAITAEIVRQEREHVLTQFQEGRVRCVVSARVLNEGIDVPDANIAILLGGALGVREQIQRIGRVLRPSPGKRSIVYEIATDNTVDADRSDRKWRKVASASAPTIPD